MVHAMSGKKVKLSYQKTHKIYIYINKWKKSVWNEVAIKVSSINAIKI